MRADAFKGCTPAAVADAVPSVAVDTAFSSIIAQDMVLVDDFQCLPPVILADPEPHDKGGDCGPAPLQHAAEALKMRRLNLAHLDLRLDWFAPAVLFCFTNVPLRKVLADVNMHAFI